MGDKRLKFQKGKQKEFLEKCIQKVGSQRKLAEFLNVGRTTLRDWKSEKSNISKSKFVFLIEKFPRFKSYGLFVEKELDWNWGRIKGGKVCIAKKKDLNKYLEYVRSHILSKRRVPKSEGLIVVNNLLEQLKKERVDLLSILAVCTLTDGALERRGNSFKISFSSSDPILINFIQALFFELGEYIPSTYGPSKGAFDTCVSDPKLGERLCELSPEFRTYALDPSKQPTISFLNNKNQQTKVWALRFGFTADGCVFLPRNIKKSKPGLNLACCNKSLCHEWMDFVKQFGISARVIKRGDYPEGVSGIRIYEHQSIRNFQKLGGFVDGVKISKKSKYHCGLPKNEVLQRAIDTFKR